MPLEVRPAREDLLLRGEHLGDFHRRERLEAELRAEAGMVFLVFREWRVLVPDVPVVHVALGVVLPGVAEVAGAAARRAGPVCARRVVLRHHLALHLRARHPLPAVEVLVVASFVEPVYRAEALVVAAPYRNRRMVAQTAQLVGELVADFVQEPVVRRVHGAGEHHVVPDEDAHFVAEVVEYVLLELSAAPHAYHVHVRALRASENLRVPRGRLLVLVRGAGNPVRALHEDAPVVHAEDEGELVLAIR